MKGEKARTEMEISALIDGEEPDYPHKKDISKKLKNRVWYIKMTGSMSRLRLWTVF